MVFWTSRKEILIYFTIMDWVRRLFTLVFWPSIDIIVALFANFMLVRSSATTAALATGVAAMSLNLIFLHLLYLEKDLQRWVHKRAKRILFLEQKFQAVEHGKNLAVLTVYLVSGPAMAGAPLIWLLGIRGIRAYTLVILGTLLNSLIWVLGIYNIFWLLIREITGRV